jgi:hypothetical protein
VGRRLLDRCLATKMLWILVAALCAVVILLMVLYRRVLNDTNHMFSLLIFVLLDDSVYKTRKADLINFVSDTKAKDAAHLSREVYASLCQVANRIAGTSVLGAHAGLWKLKREKRETPSRL